MCSVITMDLSRWPCSLTRKSESLDCFVRGFESRWVYGYYSLVFIVYCVGSGQCDELITHAEEFYWVWCVFMSDCAWDMETTIRLPEPHLELVCSGKRNSKNERKSTKRTQRIYMQAVYAILWHHSPLQEDHNLQFSHIKNVIIAKLFLILMLIFIKVQNK